MEMVLKRMEVVSPKTEESDNLGFGTMERKLLFKGNWSTNFTFRDK